MLRIARSPEPKYMPNVLGGCNCPAPYEDPVNTYLYMKSFKGGGYDRLYGTATEEMKQAILLSEKGTPCSVVLPKILRDNEELTFATFSQYVMLPSSAVRNTVDEDLPSPLYHAGGVESGFTSVEGRLRRANLLVTKTEARTLKERGNRIREYILAPVNIAGSEELRKAEKLRRRAELGNAVRGHSAYMRLVSMTGNMSDITKLIRDDWTVCVNGQPEFSYEHAEWLHKGGKGKFLTMRDLSLDEDMYLREEVSLDETLKVEGIQLDVEGKKKYLSQTTVARAGLYQIDKGMEEWAKDIVHKLKNFPLRPLPHKEVLDTFYENREWVNDDSLLIAKSIRDCEGRSATSDLCLISRDNRLGNQMANSTAHRVVMVEPSSLLGALPRKEWSGTSKVTPLEVYNVYSDYAKSGEYALSVPYKVYIDTGSLLTAAHNKGISVENGVAMMSNDVVTETGVNAHGRRYKTVKRTTIPLRSTVRTRIFDSRGLVHKRWKKYPTSYAGSSERFKFRSTPSFDRRVVHRKIHK